MSGSRSGPPGAPPRGGGSNSSPRRSSPPRRGGEQLGRFSLIHELAAGGMATLYLARAAGPAGFEKVLAIKRIHPHLAKQRYFLEMFLDEARLAARIHHPNVVQIYELGESEGSYYIAMEYVEGESLARLAGHSQKVYRVRGGTPPLPLVEAAAIVAHAAEGLHAAHELRSSSGEPLGLVHRDISPHNILITYDGYVKLIDFGVAKARGRATETIGGQLKGKIAYMAPEQVRGKAVDRRTDLFSLGVVLYEVTCRRRLFKDETEIGSIQKVLDGDIPAPSRVIPGYPPALEAVVLKALQPDPASRFKTAAEMAQAIRKVLQALDRTVAPTDIAAVMTKLFAERRALKAQLLSAAAGDAPPVDAPVEISESATLEFSVPALPTGSVATLEAMKAVGFRRRRTGLVVVGVVLSAALVAAIASPWLLRRFGTEGGVLRVVSQPAGAEVYWDGEGPVAYTPATLEPIALGAHQLVVFLRGYEPWERRLQVDTHGQKILMEAALRLSRSRPPPTEEAVDGGALGGGVLDGGVLDAARDGTHSVDAGSRGGSPAPVSRRPPRRPRPVVAREPGLLTLNSEPWADVYLEGKRLGQTPLIDVTLPAGVHQLRLLPEGKRPAKTVKIRIRSGQHLRREIQLQ